MTGKIETFDLGPGPGDRLARALHDLRIGLPVVISADGHALVALSAETVSEARLAALAELGPTHLALTARRASVLKAMVYDDDLTRIAVPSDAGIAWLRGMADPARDLESPMKGPFRPLRDRPAALDRYALKLLKAARVLPAAVGAYVADGVALADRLDLTCLDVQEAGEDFPDAIRSVATARVPLRVSADTKLHVFAFGAGQEEHYAVEIGKPSRSAPVLTRLHSACFTGDILGSLKCDCGPQLAAALDQIGAEGSGVLLYLNQEGRGIGLANKMRAYALQDQGFDTVEANHRLGFEDDERDFRIGAAILKEMRIRSVRLMTNNPAKIARMANAGINVTERVPHIYGATDENAAYLAAKAAKSGHLL